MPPPYVEVGFLLPCKARIRQVLCCCRASDCNIRILSILPAQLFVGFCYFFLQFLWQLCFQNCFPGFAPFFCEIPYIAGVQPCKNPFYPVFYFCLFKKIVISVCGNREAIRDFDALSCQVAVHLAERGVFAAYKRDILYPKLVKPKNKFF